MICFVAIKCLYEMHLQYNYLFFFSNNKCNKNLCYEYVIACAADFEQQWDRYLVPQNVLLLIYFFVCWVYLVTYCDDD